MQLERRTGNKKSKGKLVIQRQDTLTIIEGTNGRSDVTIFALLNGEGTEFD